MSMLKVEETLLGYRTTKWGGVPTVDLGNGRTRMTQQIPGGSKTNIYFYAWPIDCSKWSVAFSYAYGFQLQINPATPPVAGGQNWTFNKWGYLEKTNVWWGRFIAADNGWFPSGLEIEVYYYCPNHLAFKDWMLVYVHLKNVSGSQINFKLACYSGTMNLGANAVGKWIQADGRVACVKTVNYTMVCGGATGKLPEACFLEDAWRTNDYESTTLHSFWLRWDITLASGAETTIPIIFVFGNTENEAVTNYGIVKAYDYANTLRKEIRFWHEWLDSGKLFSSGVYEVDQLAYLTLCTIKAFQSYDNYSWPASPGLGYSTSHWPSDAWPATWALFLWGHYDEIENYFGTAMKEFVAYAVAHGTLYDDVHITNLITYQCGSGYTSEWPFVDPIVAVQLYKKLKDTTYRDNIWTWILTVMNEIDGDLISSGDFEGFFDHKNIGPSPGLWESWILGAPNTVFGNNQMAVANYNCVLARTYEEAADLADAKGEDTKASGWRAKAKKIKDALDNFYTLNHKAFWPYWGDVTEYTGLQISGGIHYPSYESVSPWDTFFWAWIGNYATDHIREAIQQYFTNYVANYPNVMPSAGPSGNWMLGKFDKASSGSDAVLWIPFVSASFIGLDDAVEDWFSRIKRKYGTLNVAFFEEGQGWDSAPAVYYSMIRSMGLWLLGFAYAFSRPETNLVKAFKTFLNIHGKEVVLLKQTGTSKDSFGNIIPSFEPVYQTRAIVESFRADEEIVKAGFASVDDRRLFFKAFAPVTVGDRIRVEDVDYAVQTVQKHHYKNRVIQKEVFAKKVIE